MNTLLSFLSSSLFSNLLAIVAIIIALLPQKDTVSITTNTIYYFPSKNNTSKSAHKDTLFGLALFLITYILYSLFYNIFPVLLVVLSFAVIIRYRFLKIAYLKQMSLPLFLVIICIFLHYFLPSEVDEFWKNAYKLNPSQLRTFSGLLNQISITSKESVQLLRFIGNSPLAVSVTANMGFVILSTKLMLEDLVAKKVNIKVMQTRTLINLSAFLSVIILFNFYVVPNSPMRIIIEAIKHFLLH